MKKILSSIVAVCVLNAFAQEQVINGNFIKTSGPLVPMPDGWSKIIIDKDLPQAKIEFIKEGEGNLLHAVSTDQSLLMDSKRFSVKKGDKFEYSIELKGKGYVVLTLITYVKKDEKASLIRKSHDFNVDSAEEYKTLTFENEIEDKGELAAENAFIRLTVDRKSDVIVKHISVYLKPLQSK